MHKKTFCSQFIVIYLNNSQRTKHIYWCLYIIFKLHTITTQNNSFSPFKSDTNTSKITCKRSNQQKHKRNVRVIAFRHSIRIEIPSKVPSPNGESNQPVLRLIQLVSPFDDLLRFILDLRPRSGIRINRPYRAQQRIGVLHFRMDVGEVGPYLHALERRRPGDGRIIGEPVAARLHRFVRAREYSAHFNAPVVNAVVASNAGVSQQSVTVVIGGCFC